MPGMISIVVVDKSAESRSVIINALNECFSIDPAQLNFFPRLSIKPLAPEELKFHSVPDICIVGPKLLLEEIVVLSKIRKLLPGTSILVRVTGLLDSLSMVEHLARLGADDILPEDISPQELLRKIILHARNAGRAKSGKLIIIDSGKGGLGVTSLAAAFGELGLEHGKKVLLVDLDFDTQDLSRFLQVRPFLNENLGSLLNQQKPVVQELVEECLTKVWADEERLYAMPPALDCEEIHDSRSSALRSMISVFEILDGLFDAVIVDSGNVRGVFRKTLYRIADNLIFVVANDPASLYASAGRIGEGLASMSPSSKLTLLQNGPKKYGLPSGLMQSELCRATKLKQGVFSHVAVPFSESASSWPGSGGTLFSRGGRTISRALRAIADESNLFTASDAVSTKERPRSSILRRIFGSRWNAPSHCQSPSDIPAIEYRPSKETAEAVPAILHLEKTRPGDNGTAAQDYSAIRSVQDLFQRAQVLN